MRKAFWFVVCALLGMFYACDSGTSSLGMEIVPESDMVSVNSMNFKVGARSILVDSVLARTSVCYLGNFTDEETGTNVQSDFIVQFSCTENYAFPDTIMGDSAITTEINLYCQEFVGDSLAPLRLSLYPLTKSLDNSKIYYTNINPKDYYDESAGPIATRTFTLSDRQLTDSARTNGYYRNIRIDLPSSLGTDMIRKFKENRKYFANADEFQKNVNKGYYVKLERGEGVMMQIYVSQLNTSFKYFTDSRLGKRDSLVNGLATFSATEEVIQANKIVNNDIQKLINDDKHAYLKTPSGIFTELTLPVEELSQYKDTINSAKLILSAYNSTVDEERALPAPQYILMVKEDNVTSFFDNYKTPDNDTSYMSKFEEEYKNAYTFSNISHLISSIRKELINGEKSDPNWKAKHPNWNKVVLIPIVPTLDAEGKVSMVEHTLDMTYIKLKSEDINLQVIFSKYKQ